MGGFLVVANQTLCDEHLLDRVTSLATNGACHFHIVVPATPSAQHFTWTMGEARAEAQRRLDDAIEQLRDRGVTVTGEVGDASPMLAVRDTLRHHRFDSIILSTFPPGMSRWLRQDLPNRMRRAFHVQVDHIMSTALVA
jgi:hypothetical protein